MLHDSKAAKFMETTEFKYLGEIIQQNALDEHPCKEGCRKMRKPYGKTHMICSKKISFHKKNISLYGNKIRKSVYNKKLNLTRIGEIKCIRKAKGRILRKMQGRKRIREKEQKQFTKIKNKTIDTIKKGELNFMDPFFELMTTD